MAKRPEDLKVFGGNLQGRHRVVMAAPSLTAFLKATGVRRGFASETWNEREIEVAMGDPGVAFRRPISRDDAPFERLAPAVETALRAVMAPGFGDAPSAGADARPSAPPSPSPGAGPFLVRIPSVHGHGSEMLALAPTGMAPDDAVRAANEVVSEVVAAVEAARLRADKGVAEGRGDMAAPGVSWRYAADRLAARGFVVLAESLGNVRRTELSYVMAPGD